MKALEIRNLSQATAGGDIIDMEVLFEGQTDWFPFTFDPSDPADSTKSVAEKLTSKNFTIAPFVPPTADELRARMSDLTPRQLRLTLLANGISPNAVTTALAGNEAGLIEWEFATEFDRLNPLILQLAPVFNLTPEQVDAMWAHGLTL